MNVIHFKDYHPFKNSLLDDAANLNKAISDLSLLGGGTLIIEKGDYFLTTVYLKSNITIVLNGNLHLFKDLSKFNLNDYKNLEVGSYENCDYDGKPSKYFIYGYNLNNVSILGNGSIDGSEEIFYGKSSRYHIDGAFYPRIPLVCLENVKNLNISNITLKRSAFWTLHLVGCNDVLIDGIKILNNMKMLNSDGIDPDHCKNLTIKNVFIKSADDCIVLKNTSAFRKYGNTENIKVINSTLMSSSAAIKVGTETLDDFLNLEFKDIKIKNSNRGISIQLLDGGSIYNAKFNNIYIETKRRNPLYFWGRAEAIAVSLLSRKENGPVGNIKGLEFNQIYALAENGILIYSLKDLDIRFNHVSINLYNKSIWKKEGIDLRPSFYGVLEGKTFTFLNQSPSKISLNDFKECKE